jgi:hypothetical protein
MRRLARDRNLYTFYGPPTAFHNRKPRPLFCDLKAELFGLEHIDDFAEYLERAPLRGEDVLDDFRTLIGGNQIIYSDDDFWAAWLDDCAKVMG